MEKQVPQINIHNKVCLSHTQSGTLDRNTLIEFNDAQANHHKLKYDRVDSRLSKVVSLNSFDDINDH